MTNGGGELGIEIKKKTLLINSVSALVERVISLSVLVWLTAYLVRHVSKDEFVIYKAIAAIIVFGPLIALAVVSGVARYVTHAYAQHDERRVTQIVSTTAPFFAGLAVLAMAIGFALAWNVEHILRIGPNLAPEPRAELITQCHWMFTLMVIQVAVRIVCLPFQVGLLVRQKFVWVDALTLGAAVLNLALLFSLLFGVGTKVLYVVIANFVPAVLNQLAQTWLSRRLVPAARFDRNEIRWELLPPVLSFGIWSLVTRAVASARQTAGILLLSRYPFQGTTWSLGATVDNQIFPSALKPLAAVQPAMTAMHATGQEDRFRRYYFRYCRYILWGLLFLGVPLIVHRKEIWALYIPETTERLWLTPTVMVLLYAKVIFLFPLPMLAQVSLARAKVGAMAIRTVAVDAVTVAACLIVVLALHGGARAVAMAQLAVAVVAGPLVYWPFGLQLTDSKLWPFLRYTVVPGLLPAAVAGPFTYAMRWVIPVETWVHIGVHAVLCALVYAVTIVFVCPPGERDDLRKIFAKVRGVLPGRAAT